MTYVLMFNSKHTIHKHNWIMYVYTYVHYIMNHMSIWSDYDLPLPLHNLLQQIQIPLQSKNNNYINILIGQEECDSSQAPAEEEREKDDTGINWDIRQLLVNVPQG